MFLSGRRKPIVIAIMATIFSCGAVYGLVKLLTAGFEASCTDVLKVYLFKSMVFGKVGQVLLVRWDP